MKQIKTIKGKFIIINKTSESSYPLDIWMAHHYPKIRYRGYCKLVKITEEQAEGIVGVGLFDNYLLTPKDYYRDILYSLVRNEGLEITDSTYIFKV